MGSISISAVNILTEKQLFMAEKHPNLADIARQNFYCYSELKIFIK